MFKVRSFFLLIKLCGHNVKNLLNCLDWFLFLCVQICMCACIRNTCAQCLWRPEEGKFTSKMELQMAVHGCVAELWKSSQCPHLRSHLSEPPYALDFYYLSFVGTTTEVRELSRTNSLSTVWVLGLRCRYSGLAASLLATSTSSNPRATCSVAFITLIRKNDTEQCCLCAQTHEGLWGLVASHQI